MRTSGAGMVRRITTARWGGIERIAGSSPSQGERGRDSWRGDNADRGRPSRPGGASRPFPPRPRRTDAEPREDRRSPGWEDDADSPRRAGGGGWGDDDVDGDSQPRQWRPRRVDGGGEMPQRKWLTSREKREAKPDAKPTWAETLRGEALFGVAPVRAALLAKRRPKVYTLFVQDSVDAGRRKEGGGGLADLVARATALGAAVQQVDKHELNLLTENRNHQGVVLDAAPLEPEEVDVLPQIDDVSAAPPVWLALDQVSDPQNLGAILRSALFLGAAGVVVAQRNSAPLSPVVSKASAGAMEVLPVHVVSGNMPQFLAASSANGWTVLGADMGDAPGDARVVPCSDVVVEGPTILVLGSEGEGLRTNVLRVCDRLVCVPRGAGDVDDTAVEARAFVDSLNVSVAAGVVLHSLLHSRKKQ